MTSRTSKIVWSLSAVVVLTLILVVAWSYHVGKMQGMWYRWTGDFQAFAGAIQRGDVRSGDSTSRLHALLGPPVVPPLSEQARYRAANRKFAAISPGEYPDGVEDSDTFEQYETGGILWSFQIRAGRIINFKPEHLVPPKLLSGP